MLILYAIILVPEMMLKNQIARIGASVVTGALSFLAGPYFIAYGSLIYWDLVGIKGPSAITEKKGRGSSIVLAMFCIMLVMAAGVIYLKNPYSSITERSRDTDVLANMMRIQMGLDAYSNKNGFFPQNLEELIKDGLYYHDMKNFEYQADYYNYELCFELEKDVAEFSAGRNCVTVQLNQIPIDNSESGNIPEQ